VFPLKPILPRSKPMETLIRKFLTQAPSRTQLTRRFFINIPELSQTGLLSVVLALVYKQEGSS
jgi:hypothetical protein